MAKKPNYGFEKRQKELARQKKKEEKRERKKSKGEDPLAENTEENGVLEEEETD
jgi:hypothetical protein